MVVFLIEVVIRDDWIILMILLSKLDGTLILKRLGDVTHRVEIYGGFSLPQCTPSTSGGCRFQQGIADTSAIPSVMSRQINFYSGVWSSNKFNTRNEHFRLVGVIMSSTQ